jgi:hypothetical protein
MRAVRMKKLVGLFVFAALIAGASFGQAAQSQQGESQSGPPVQVRKVGPTKSTKRKKGTPAAIPKMELAASASFNRYVAPPGYYVDMTGWNSALNYNLRTWAGAQIEASGDYGRKAYFGHSSVYTLLVGPQFFPLHHHKITPWGHFLFGEGYYRNPIPEFGGFQSQVKSDVAFVWEAGAGIDIRYKEHWSIRFPQFDYVSTRFLRTAANQPAQADYRASIGVIYRIGKR